jgi:transcriptional regulator with GAF, ATPase, and Fis domain
VQEDRDLSVDIRLIAATHHNLAAMVREGRFHSELYFRIQTVPLHVPALRERPQDIPLLATALVEELVKDLGRGAVELTECALEALQSYRWPGNLRELRNVLEGALLRSRGSQIDASAFRFDSGPGGAGPGRSFRGSSWKGVAPSADFSRWQPIPIV